MEAEKLHQDAMTLANQDLTTHFNSIIQKLLKAANQGYWLSLKQLFLYWTNNHSQFNEQFSKEEKEQIIYLLHAKANTNHDEALNLLFEVYQNPDIIGRQLPDFKAIAEMLNQAAEYNLEKLTAFVKPYSQNDLPKDKAEIESKIKLHEKQHEDILEKILTLCYRADAKQRMQYDKIDTTSLTTTVISTHRNTMQAGHHDLACSSLNNLYDFFLSTHLHRVHHRTSSDNIMGFELSTTLPTLYAIYTIGAQRKHVPSMLALAFCLKAKSNSNTNRFDIPLSDDDKNAYQLWSNEAFTRWGIPRCREYEHSRNELIVPSLLFQRSRSRLEFIDEVTQQQLSDAIQNGDYEKFAECFDVYQVPMTTSVMINPKDKTTQNLMTCIAEKTPKPNQPQFMRFIMSRGYEPLFSSFGTPELSEYHCLHNVISSCPPEIFGLIFQYLSIDLNSGTNKLCRNNLLKTPPQQKLLLSTNAQNADGKRKRKADADAEADADADANSDIKTDADAQENNGSSKKRRIEHKLVAAATAADSSSSSVAAASARDSQTTHNISVIESSTAAIAALASQSQESTYKL